jgi:hypothetical protein
MDVIIKNITLQFKIIKDYNLSLNLELMRFQEYPQLIKKNINTILYLVKFTKYQNKAIDKELNLEVSDIIHTFNHFEYYFVDSLTKILPYKEVIKLIQNFIDELTHSKRELKNYLNNLQELLNNFQNFLEKWHDLDDSLEIINGKKLIYKIKKYMWAEVLKEFKPEIGNTLMYHQDFKKAKNLNPNFVHTRTHTLMKGDEPCDFCYHNTRNIKDIYHPSNEFWHNFN